MLFLGYAICIFGKDESFMRFSEVTVSAVLGVNRYIVSKIASELGIKTNRQGYTVNQVKVIRDYHASKARKCRKIGGTVEQLRAELETA